MTGYLGEGNPTINPIYLRRKVRRRRSRTTCANPGQPGKEKAEGAVSDEPFYARGKKPPAPMVERLWEVRKDHVTWTCDLRFHGERSGWEAMILRDGLLLNAQRFDLKRSSNILVERAAAGH